MAARFVPLQQVTWQYYLYVQYFKSNFQIKDLKLHCSVSHGVEEYEDRHCVVTYDGKVLWASPTVFHSYCNLNFVMWPFETNICKLTIGSWTFDGSEVEVQLDGKGFSVR